MDLSAENKTWLAFKRGDRNALDQLFRTYYPMLYLYGLKIHSHRDIIEESLQEFFLYLFEHRQQLAVPKSVRSYLFKAYRRRLLRQLDKYRTTRKLSENQMPWQPDIQISADEILIRGEENDYQKSVLQKLIQQLPARQREVIYLRYYNNLAIDEIAEVLSISYQGTVNTIYKALKTLRKDVNLRQINALFSFLIFSLNIIF